MVKLYETGAYLLNGSELVPDDGQAQAVLASKGVQTSKEDASKNTMAYGILEAHNTSGNMEQLKIKFDKMTSHDITFVGIIQTARASGLTEFPIPYVLTNCHNFVRGWWNNQRGRSCVWSFLCKEIRRNLCTTSSGGYPSVRKRDACRMWSYDSWL